MFNKEHTMKTIQLPDIKEGEKYAGFTMKDGLPADHIILIPGEPDDELNWEYAKAWAADQGGELPDRQAGALLYANLKSEFKSDWYWLSEQYSPYLAWLQTFNTGYQDDYDKDNAFRVRAVRRLPIQ
jgi:hypothetical protein